MPDDSQRKNNINCFSMVKNYRKRSLLSSCRHTTAVRRVWSRHPGQFRAVGETAAKLPARIGGEQGKHRTEPPVRRLCVDRHARKVRAQGRPPCASSGTRPSSMDMDGAGHRRRRIRGFRLCARDVSFGLAVLGGHGHPPSGHHGGGRTTDGCCRALRLVRSGAGGYSRRAAREIHALRRARRGHHYVAATAAGTAGGSRRRSVHRSHALRRSQQRRHGRGHPAAWQCSRERCHVEQDREHLARGLVRWRHRGSGCRSDQGCQPCQRNPGRRCVAGTGRLRDPQS